MRVIDRDGRVASFQETQDKYRIDLENKQTFDVRPNAHFYLDGIVRNQINRRFKDSFIAVYNEDVVERVFTEANLGYRVGVMNFASARKPGGQPGANAQEEVLIRSSYLLPSISQFYPQYYKRNVEDNRHYMYTDDLIYSKDIPFVKRRVSKEFENFVDPVLADVVTIAAPNRTAMINHLMTVDYRELTRILVNRIYHTLRAFKASNCESIILGAFGCGVFGNDPAKVAKIFHLLLDSDEFKNCFKRVIFSVYETPSSSTGNFKAFNREFKKR